MLCRSDSLLACSCLDRCSCPGRCSCLVAWLCVARLSSACLCSVRLCSARLCSVCLCSVCLCSACLRSACLCSALPARPTPPQGTKIPLTLGNRVASQASWWRWSRGRWPRPRGERRGHPPRRRIGVQFDYGTLDRCVNAEGAENHKMWSRWGLRHLDLGIAPPDLCHGAPIVVTHPKNPGNSCFFSVSYLGNPHRSGKRKERTCTLVSHGSLVLFRDRLARCLTERDADGSRARLRSGPREARCRYAPKCLPEAPRGRARLRVPTLRQPLRCAARPQDFSPRRSARKPVCTSPARKSSCCKTRW